MFVVLSHGFSLVTIIESVVWIIPLIATIIAWRKRELGGYFFLITGIAYAFIFDNIYAILFLAVPLMITGVLFIIDKRYNRFKL